MGFSLELFFSELEEKLEYYMNDPDDLDLYNGLKEFIKESKKYAEECGKM